MKAAAVRTIEQLADLSASIAFGGAVGFAGYALIDTLAVRPALGVCVVALGGLSCLASQRLLSAISPNPAKDRAVGPAAPLAASELTADFSIDRDAGSRVVRLFDPSQQAGSAGSASDASQDLRAALEQLRRSLR